ncbi:MAG: L-seryl-tRNA(Sec) selenium transferase [Candidatus Eremiobacteraeota bacterium]|nr:L-seryl-tRNA(Sec) selenium transferase [Candidatus Eremiobacteraeota bacterium]MBV9263557.1 L-seryl-tRNA(Sec) selenium transferase [Candidatus Eremiobacteraeota bacterium]
MHRLLGEPEISRHEPALGRETIKAMIGRLFDRLRASRESPPYVSIVESLSAELEAALLAQLQPAINATGIVVHTNLGRAPLAAEAQAAIAEISRSYSNLEFDLEGGDRGSRYAHVTGTLKEVTGAQDALVVNNCAAAVLLMLDTFAKGREVVVARGELIEIGGGFRLPEVLARSGATLVEVGTTNRVYIKDFEAALSARTALLLRTHPSNYRLEGFTAGVEARELVALGQRAGAIVAEDLGSGALFDLAQLGLPHERTVREALADGIGLVTFSGDKVLGGPQAGIVVGRANLIARLRNNPLLRALRVDKMTLAALAATLQLYRDGSYRERVPVVRMLSASVADLRRRAERYCAAIPEATAVESDAYVGGGASPQTRIPSIAMAIVIEKPNTFAAHLRRAKPPIVARVDGSRVLLDLRTIAPVEDADVIAALRRHNA